MVSIVIITIAKWRRRHLKSILQLELGQLATGHLDLLAVLAGSSAELELSFAQLSRSYESRISYQSGPVVWGAAFKSPVAQG